MNVNVNYYPEPFYNKSCLSLFYENSQHILKFHSLKEPDGRKLCAVDEPLKIPRLRAQPYQMWILAKIFILIYVLIIWWLKQTNQKNKTILTLKKQI